MRKLESMSMNRVVKDRVHSSTYCERGNFREHEKQGKLAWFPSHECDKVLDSPSEPGSLEELSSRPTVPLLSERAQRALSKIKARYEPNSISRCSDVAIQTSDFLLPSKSIHTATQQKTQHTTIFYNYNSIKEAEQERRMGRMHAHVPCRYPDAAAALAELLHGSAAGGFEEQASVSYVDYSDGFFKVHAPIYVRSF